jgi:hypothetical protein
LFSGTIFRSAPDTLLGRRCPAVDFIAFVLALLVVLTLLAVLIEQIKR